MPARFYEFEGTKYAPKGKGEKNTPNLVGSKRAGHPVQPKRPRRSYDPRSADRKNPTDDPTETTALQSYCIGNDFVYSFLITRLLNRKIGTRRLLVFYEFEGTKYAPKGKGEKTLRISAEASAQATQCNPKGHEDHRTPVGALEKNRTDDPTETTALQSYCI